jgi:hypothetical protein
MENVPIQVAEEDQTVTFDRERLTQEFDARLPQLTVRRVEIVDVYGEMPNPRILHLIRPAVSYRGNNLQHRAVERTHEIVAVIFGIDDELEIVGVPLRELFRIRGCNSRVLQTFEHIPRFYQAVNTWVQRRGN